MVFTAQEFSQTLPRYSPVYGDTENMFYLFFKIIIFCLSKDLNFFHETVTSHNLEAEPNI